MATPRMDMEQLKREPESAFETPMDAVSNEGLSTEQKKEVLTAWDGLVSVRRKRKEISAGEAERLLRQIQEARTRLRSEP